MNSQREVILMSLRDENDRKRLAALASAKARGGFEAVSPRKLTAGAANSGHIVPLAPRKPDGLLRINRKNLISEFPRVKIASLCDFMA
jgi:hypothetical protein